MRSERIYLQGLKECEFAEDCISSIKCQKIGCSILKAYATSYHIC